MSQLRTGIQGSLNTPGLAVANLVTPPPTPSNGAKLLSGVMQSLGAGLGALQTSLQVKQEEMAYHEGLGARQAREWLPGLQQHIADRSVVVPDGMPLTDFADQLIDGQVEGLNEYQARGFRQHRADVLGYLERQEAVFRKESRLELQQLLTDRAVSADDPSTIAATAHEMEEQFQVTRTESFAMTALPAMRSAAANGDVVRFKAATAVLGDTFQAEQRAAELVIRRGLIQQQEAVDTELREEVSRLLNDNAPTDLIHELIGQYKGKAGETSRLRESDRAERYEAEKEKLHVKKTVAAEMEWAGNHFDELAYAAAASATSTGGFHMIDNIAPDVPRSETHWTVTTSDGKENKIAIKPVLRKALERREAELQEKFGDQAFPHQVALYSANGIANPRWESLLKAGFSQRTFASLAEGGEVPKALDDAFDLYKRLKAQDPAALSLHIQSSEQRLYYEAARIAEQHFDQGNSHIALTRAAQAAQNAAFSTGLTDTLNAEEFRTAIRRSVGDDATNAADASRKIEMFTRIFMATETVGPQSSLEAAVDFFEETHTEIDGIWINTANMVLPENMEDVVGFMKSGFLKTNPDPDFDGDEDDIALMPTRDGTAFQLYDRRGIIPTPLRGANGGPIIMTSLDVARSAELMRIARENEVRQETIREQNELQSRTGPTLREALKGSLNFNNKPPLQTRFQLQQAFGRWYGDTIDLPVSEFMGDVVDAVPVAVDSFDGSLDSLFGKPIDGGGIKREFNEAVAANLPSILRLWNYLTE